MIERNYEITPSYIVLLPPLVNTMLAVRPRFREILKTDLDAIGDLLTRSFVHRSREYWMRGLRHQGSRSLPQDAPRYGYLLEHQGAAVGCLLDLKSDGTIARAALCVSGLGPAPVRVAAAERLQVGQLPSHEAFRAAAVEAETLEATTDIYVSAAYRKHLARILTYRALERAVARGHERMAA